MSQKQHAINPVARRYARALFLVISEQGEAAQKEIEKQCYALEGVLAQLEEVRLVLENPLIPIRKQEEGLVAILKETGGHEVLERFIHVLAGHRRLAIIGDILAAYRGIMEGEKNIKKVHVTSAIALSGEQKEKLSKNIERALGVNVVLSAETDASLIGGLVVQYGSHMVDGSIRTQLSSLQTMMNEAS